MVDLGQLRRHPVPEHVPVRIPRNEWAIWEPPRGSIRPFYVLATSSLHPGGCNFAMCDGSVRFIKDTISIAPFDPTTGIPGSELHGLHVHHDHSMGIYQQLSTRNGGEVVSSDSY